MFPRISRLLAFVALFSSSIAHAEQPLSDEVVSLFRDGRAAYARNDLEAAHAAFSEAFEKSGGAPKIAANLAVVELDLGKHRDAADHAALAIAHEDDETMREALRQNLDDAKKHIVTVTLSHCPDGDSVRVGGKILGRCPLPLGEIHLEPGRHIVEVDGYHPKEVTLAKGETVQVELMVVYPDELDRPLRQPTTGDEAPAPGGLPLAPAIVGGAVGVVALAVGGGLRVLGSSEEDKANSLRDDLRAHGGDCSTGRCEELLDRYGKADTAYNAGLTSLIVGGVITAGAIAYTVAYVLHDEEEPSPELAITLGPGNAYVTFTFPLSR